jgi:hypothetical protein
MFLTQERGVFKNVGLLREEGEPAHLDEDQLPRLCIARVYVLGASGDSSDIE